jgi:ABC-2 type transport system ATP-binding protein
VDPVARQRFWQVVETLAAQGMTVMVTTHNLEEAYYCHRIGLMHQGRLLALDDIDGLRAELGVEADASVEFVFAGFLAREQG